MHEVLRVTLFLSPQNKNHKYTSCRVYHKVSMHANFKPDVVGRTCGWGPLVDCTMTFTVN